MPSVRLRLLQAVKVRAFALGAVVVAAALVTAAPQASAQAINPTMQNISLPGSPFAVTPTPDGRYAFASLSGDTNGIAIIALPFMLRSDFTFSYHW